METKSLIGSTLGNRFLIKNVFEGGMGTVFLVQDRNLELLVLKTIKLQGQDVEQRFIKEAKTVSTIRSDFVVESRGMINGVNLFDSTISNDMHWKYGDYSPLIKEHDNVFIMMEYCEGGNLRSCMRQKPFSADECINYALEFCYGMLDCQYEVPGLVHRDLKPENLLFKENRLKIADFGLVRQEHQSRILSESQNEMERSSLAEMGTQDGSILGTIPYMSPEQISGQTELGITSDIFAYGVILFEMFTGHRLLTGKYSEIRQNLLSTSPLPSIIKVSNIDRRIGQLIDKCLVKKSAHRPQDWQEVFEMWKSFVIPLGEDIKKDPSRLGFYPIEELVSTRWIAATPNDSSKGGVYGSVNMKPANSLRKAEDLFRLDQYKDAINVIDDVLEINNDRDDQQKLYIHLKALMDDQQATKVSGLTLVLNIGPFVELFIDLRSRCYANHLDSILMQNMKVGKVDLHDDLVDEAKINALVAVQAFPKQF